MSKIAIQNHSDPLGHDLCSAGNNGYLATALCNGSHLTLAYSSLGSWANGAVLDGQGRLLVVGASVLSASDTDQASARITGF